jgi:hypothetical protein
MMDRTKHFLGHGCHGRSLIVESIEAICFECKEKKHVLYFDNSDSEYTAMRLCIDCLSRFANGHISSSGWKNDYDDF